MYILSTLTKIRKGGKVGSKESSDIQLIVLFKLFVYVRKVFKHVSLYIINNICVCFLNIFVLILLEQTKYFILN